MFGHKTVSGAPRRKMKVKIKTTTSNNAKHLIKRQGWTLLSINQPAGIFGGAQRWTIQKVVYK